ncbi:hypothetical protein MMC14_001158 [Varicellaria rhodocarpa]|nr:hypothetical protein [Varicellaria rhodocarpa]
MASNEPSQCCTIGVKHEGQPQGKMITIGKTEAYIATPSSSSSSSTPNPTVAILILTDVIGHAFPNAQLIADQFAANNYLTLMPDLFAGDPVPLQRGPGFQLQDWLVNHTPAHTEPVVTAAIKYLREELKVQRVGAVGYCFGGKYVVRGLGEGGGVDVGILCHPSFVEEGELEGVKGPVGVAAAETDTIFPAEKRHRSEEVLKKVGVPYQFNLYSGVEHGFAVRADLSTKVAKYAKEAAFLQAVQWFDTHLKQ